MIDLQNVSLVAIDGVGNDTNTIKALKYSSNKIKFASVKYLTAGKFHPNFCETIQINKMTWDEYNKFCLISLSDYIDTEFVILIQSDGFIINPDLWNDNFLNYDYIGAPWPIENLRCNLPRWPMVLDQAFKNKLLYQIGNGGFTIRSKKLLDNTKKLYKDSMFGLPEDIVISILLREQMQMNGLNFTNDIKFASTFSCEAKNIDGLQLDSNKSFGFHCKDTHKDKVNLLNNINLEELFT